MSDFEQQSDLPAIDTTDEAVAAPDATEVAETPVGTEPTEPTELAEHDGTEEAPTEGEDPTMAAGTTPAADSDFNGTETSTDSYADVNSPTLNSEGTEADDAMTADVEAQAPASQDDGTSPPLALGAAEPEAPVAVGAEAQADDAETAPADAGAGAPGAAAAPAAAEVAQGGAPVKQAEDAEPETHIGGAVDSAGAPAKPMQVPVDPVTGIPLETLAHPKEHGAVIFGGGQAPVAASPTGQVSTEQAKADEDGDDK